MATYTSNYGWTKPSGSDPVDISVLNNNLDDQDSTIHNAFLNMAPPFSESSTYAVDDIVLYGTGLYKCHTAVVTPGSWTGSTNWDEYKLSEGGSSTGGEVKNLDNGMLSHSTDSSYITVNLDVALTAGKEYKITLRDPAYNYVDTKQITWTATRDVIFEGNGGGQYKIQLTQTTASLYNYSGQGWRDIYCDIVSDFETVTAAQTTYDNTDSGLSATDVQEAVDELAESYPASKVMMSDGVTSVEDRLDANVGRVVKSVTADGIKTVSQILDELYTARSVNNYIDLNGLKALPASATRYSVVSNSADCTPIIRSIILQQSGSICKISTMSTTGVWSLTDISNNVPIQGSTYKMITMY